MQQEMHRELSKRPIKVFDEGDLVSAQHAGDALREEIKADLRLSDAWASTDGRIIQADILKEQRKLERDAMDIPLTEVNKIAINRGMWRALEELKCRHIIKKGEAARKEGLLSVILRKTSELAERLIKKKVVIDEAKK